jgi:osmotically-inducible protein OsmY
MTDKQLQENVLAALEWEPSIDSADIGVTVDHSVVTLRGDVHSFTEKATAERVALGVYGVKALANDLTVRLTDGQTRTDSDIALAASNAFKWSTEVPAERVTISVSRGWLTLKGEVDWHYQRDAAARLVRDLRGVTGVANEISVRPRVSATDVQSKIEAALTRSAELDARRIHVGTRDGKVTLTGNVTSWTERQEAERAAWAAPGVREVDDRLVVVP